MSPRGISVVTVPDNCCAPTCTSSAIPPAMNGTAVSGTLATISYAPRRAMLPTVARLGVPYVCMHWRGHSADMQSRAVYADLAGEVVAELAEQIEAALAAGIRRDRLILDPGFGFAKTGEHNWELLNRQELEAQIEVTA